MKYFLLLSAVVIVSLFSGCSTTNIRFYVPNPVPAPLKNEGNTLSLHGGIPNYAEYQRKIGDKTDFVVNGYTASSSTGTSSSTYNGTSTGLKYWLSGRDTNGFGICSYIGFHYLMNNEQYLSWNQTGADIALIPGLYFKSFSIAIPLRYGIGSITPENGSYNNISCGINLQFKGETFGCGINGEYAVGAGNLTAADKSQIALIPLFVQVGFSLNWFF